MTSTLIFLVAMLGVSAGKAPTVEEARTFLQNANKELGEVWSLRERSAFVNQTYITDDTTYLASVAEEKAMEVEGRITRQAKRFIGMKLPADLERQLKLLLLASTLPAPDDAKLRGELANLSTGLTSLYGKGEACGSGFDKPCLKLDEAERILAKDRDYDKLERVWTAWHKVGAPMRNMFTREVEIANKGARDIGYADLSELWKSNYDMSPAVFEQETERLWNDVRPLYEQMHCYARQKLSQKYGTKIKNEGTLPAHVFGNMWAQEWDNIIDLLQPYPSEPAFDVTKALQSKNYDVLKMVKGAEGFFTSLGLDPLPETYWTRSMLQRPRDREVVCHASAWDISGEGDLRMKACFEVKGEDFDTAHHELGHNYYYMYYKHLPAIFRTGANDGFHEGIGDTLLLSMTDQYYKQVGLLAAAQPSNDRRIINEQMAKAAGTVAFLPFGLLIDRWRWEVFSGRTKPENYNKRWWELRQKYQGIHAPVARTEADFDPGAKYHIPGNTPYTRYFLARILQFQFHRGLCKAAGHTGPLHECSIYGNKAAGDKLKAMLALGASKPWPEALAVATGETKLDSSALIEYFQPLMAYLKKQNEGQRCGW